MTNPILNYHTPSVQPYSKLHTLIHVLSWAMTLLYGTLLCFAGVLCCISFVTYPWQRMYGMLSIGGMCYLALMVVVVLALTLVSGLLYLWTCTGIAFLSRRAIMIALLVTLINICLITAILLWSATLDPYSYMGLRLSMYSRWAFWPIFQVWASIDVLLATGLSLLLLSQRKVVPQLLTLHVIIRAGTWAMTLLYGTILSFTGALFGVSLLQGLWQASNPPLTMFDVIQTLMFLLLTLVCGIMYLCTCTGFIRRKHRSIKTAFIVTLLNLGLAMSMFLILACQEAVLNIAPGPQTAPFSAFMFIAMIDVVVAMCLYQLLRMQPQPLPPITSSASAIVMPPPSPVA